MVFQRICQNNHQKELKGSFFVRIFVKRITWVLCLVFLMFYGALYCDAWGRDRDSLCSNPFGDFHVGIYDGLTGEKLPGVKAKISFPVEWTNPVEGTGQYFLRQGPGDYIPVDSFTLDNLGNDLGHIVFPDLYWYFPGEDRYNCAGTADIEFTKDGYLSYSGGMYWLSSLFPLSKVYLYPELKATLLDKNDPSRGEVSGIAADGKSQILIKIKGGTWDVL